MNLLPVFLQRVIFFVVFCEVKGLRFCRHPLAGIIQELAAFSYKRHDTFLDAEDLLIINFCAVSAVNAGFFYLFTKELNANSLNAFLSLYMRLQKKATFIFLFRIRMIKIAVDMRDNRKRISQF